MKLKPPKLLNLRRQPSSDKVPTTATTPKQGWDSTLGIAGLIGIALLVAAFLILFIFQSYRVKGQSMEPTLQNSDWLVIDKVPRSLARLTHHAYIPHRGDIIVFSQWNVPGYSGTTPLIKRVVGLPGDRITVKNGSITIYNTTHPTGFDPDNGYHIQVATIAPVPIDIRLAAGQLFVCGDNRANSEDSRYFGPINASQVIGKLSVRFFPINHANRF